jgi:hypothetical protein
MTSENIETMIESMNVKDQDDIQQSNVKKAIQLILKTAKQGIVPLCQEISKIVIENHELQIKATKFEVIIYKNKMLNACGRLYSNFFKHFVTF